MISGENVDQQDSHWPRGNLTRELDSLVCFKFDHIYAV